MKYLVAEELGGQGPVFGTPVSTVVGERHLSAGAVGDRRVVISAGPFFGEGSVE